MPDLKYVFPIPLLSINPSEIYSPKPDNPSFVILVSCNNGKPRKPSRLLSFNSLRLQRKFHLKLLRSGRPLQSFALKQMFERHRLFGNRKRIHQKPCNLWDVLGSHFWLLERRGPRWPFDQTQVVSPCAAPVGLWKCFGVPLLAKALIIEDSCSPLGASRDR